MSKRWPFSLLNGEQMSKKGEGWAPTSCEFWSRLPTRSHGFAKNQPSIQGKKKSNLNWLVGLQKPPTVSVLLTGDHQLRVVVYPIIFRVSAPSQVVSQISAINSITIGIHQHQTTSWDNFFSTHRGHANPRKPATPKDRIQVCPKKGIPLIFLF